MTVPVLHARGRNGGSLRFAHTNSFLQSRIIVRARRSIDMRARWKNLSTDRVGGVKIASQVFRGSPCRLTLRSVAM